MIPMSPLEKELSSYSCGLNREQFRGLVSDKFATMFRNKTDEWLVVRPSLGIKFCDAIRQTATCEDLPDYLILNTLLNCRKNP
jgi:hypothetical protein